MYKRGAHDSWWGGGWGSRRWYIPLLSKGGGGQRGQQKEAPGGKRVATKKPTIVFSDLHCLPNPSVTRHKIQIKFVELNWILYGRLCKIKYQSRDTIPLNSPVIVYNESNSGVDRWAWLRWSWRWGRSWQSAAHRRQRRPASGSYSGIIGGHNKNILHTGIIAGHKIYFTLA